MTTDPSPGNLSLTEKGDLVSDPICRVDVALRTYRDLYVTALSGAAGWYLAGVSQRILGWENFTLLRLSDREVALKTAHSTYVTAYPKEDDWALRGRANRILGWESFQIAYLSEVEAFGRAEPGREFSVALRTAHGKWVRCHGLENSYRISGDSVDLQEDCRFTLRVL